MLLLPLLTLSTLSTATSSYPDASSTVSVIPTESAADAPECTADAHLISSPYDLSKIEHCKTVHGDVVIDNYEYPMVSFENIESIDGSLIIRNSPELVRVEAVNVHTIKGTFSAVDLTSLSLLAFDSLASVKSLYWKVLPILSNVHLSEEIKDLESITVSDTSLTGFSGFSAKTLQVLDINNNRFLEEIVCNVEEITGKLHVAANAHSVKVRLPELTTANNISIHDVGEFDVSKLESVANSVLLIENDLSTLNLPELTSVGGTFSISKNEKLHNVKVPALKEIGGGLVITDNNLIDKVDFFPELVTIGGALEISGPIKEVSIKSLKLVKGSAKIKSTDGSFDCSKWSKTSSISLVVRGGKIECTNSKNQKIISDPRKSEGNFTFDDSVDFERSKSSASLAMVEWSLFLLGVFMTI